MRKLFFVAIILLLGIFSKEAIAQAPEQVNPGFEKLKLIQAKLDSNNTVIAVKVGAPVKETIEAVLTHSIGWVVEKKSIKLMPGTNSFSFNVAQLAEGTYRLILRNSSNNWTASQTIKK
jgi:hypothetical protein